MRCVTLLVLCAAACGGGGGPGTPDGGGSNDPDGPVDPQHGLAIQWSAHPALPGPVHGDITVTSAQFTASFLEVIGDAGPGDLRTTEALFRFTWDANGQPAPILFQDAPAGLYSTITMHLDGGPVPSYDIEGTAKVDGVTRNFEIVDRDDVRVSIDHLDTTLAPGGGVTIPIDLALDEALAGVNFSQLTDDGGVLTLEGDDPQLDQFRDRIIDAFTTHGSDQLHEH
jgi:hypothetical protein